MNKNQFFYTLFPLCLFAKMLYCMEDNKKTNKTLSCEQFRKEKRRLSAQMKSRCSGRITERDIENNSKILRSIAELALRTDMSNHQKLQNICGDEHWKIRKKIIVIMIRQQQIHPDTIEYLFSTPLEESIIYDDVPFATYLLKKGARKFEQSTTKRASTQMLALLQEYKIIE